MNDEIETQSLSVCRFRAYSKTRRGMPIMPSGEQRQERRVERR